MNEIFSTILSYEVKARDTGKTVEQIIKREFAVSSGLLKELKLSGKLKINGIICRSIDIVSCGDTVSADIEENERSEIMEYEYTPEILFEDAHLTVVNKPAGLSVHPCRGSYEKNLAGAIIRHWRKNGEEHNFHAVNRLDKDTSGICVIAKNRYSHSVLSGYNTFIKKEYSAVVHGKICKAGVIDLPIKRDEDSVIKRKVSNDGKKAVTVYEPIEFSDKYTLLKIKLLTGRTHQIRVHFSHIGHPLFGDWLYGKGDEEKELITRQALVSDLISFRHPVSGRLLEFSVCLPEDIKILLKKL